MNSIGINIFNRLILEGVFIEIVFPKGMLLFQDNDAPNFDTLTAF